MEAAQGKINPEYIGIYYAPNADAGIADADEGPGQGAEIYVEYLNLVLVL